VGDSPVSGAMWGHCLGSRVLGAPDSFQALQGRRGLFGTTDSFGTYSYLILLYAMNYFVITLSFDL